MNGNLPKYLPALVHLSPPSHCGSFYPCIPSSMHVWTISLRQTHSLEEWRETVVGREREGSSRRGTHGSQDDGGRDNKGRRILTGKEALIPECRAWEPDGRRPVNRRRTPPEERCGGLLSANPGQMIIISRDPKLQRDSERDGKRKIALTLLFCFSLLFSVSLLFPYFLKSSVIMWRKRLEMAHPPLLTHFLWISKHCRELRGSPSSWAATTWLRLIGREADLRSVTCISLCFYSFFFFILSPFNVLFSFPSDT